MKEEGEIEEESLVTEKKKNGPIENEWNAEREGAGRCRHLQPFPVIILTDTPV